MNKLTGFFLWLVLPVLTQAQTTFEVVFDGPEDEFGMGVEQTTDGGYILSGFQDANMLLRRTDANGTELWSHTYGTANMDIGYCVRQTTDGGFILCGMYNGFGTDTLTLVRTDAAGNTQWIKHYRGTLGRDLGYAVQQTLDGGFIVCGSSGPSLDDVYVVRTDATGIVMWSSTIDLGAGEMAMAVEQTADDGSIVLVQNSGVGNPDGELYLLRFDALGDTMWSRTIATPGPDEARGLAIADDGGFIIAGGNGYPARDLLIVRTDDQGQEQWRQVHGDAQYDEMATDIHALPGGELALGGRKEDPNTGDIGMYLARTDATGTIQWERSFPRGAMSEALALDPTSDGGFVLFGSTVEVVGMFAEFDSYLVKTDGAGYSSVEDADARAPVLLLYPNPVRDRLFVQYDGTGTLRCIDATGRTVSSAPVHNNGLISLVVGNLEPGAYMLMVTSGQGRTNSARFVVDR
ncbi:MAG: T9SS type A sorting domain-containing protein [Flavobacteriales bacterium]|nr:MAG: T9SS type A sorting domain-containing protein [Flavobacteriales bacterium]